MKLYTVILRDGLEKRTTGVSSVGEPRGLVLFHCVFPKQFISITHSHYLVNTIGKTRFGQELFNQIKIDLPEINRRYDIPQGKWWNDVHFEYLHIDFGNGHALTKQDFELDTSVIIGLRIAHAFFIGKQYGMTLQEFRIALEAYVGKDSIYNLFNTHVVIKEIHKSLNLHDDNIFHGRLLFLFLHIDEFQLIDSWDKENISNPTNLFRDMIHIISMFMLSPTSDFFVMPFLSGTAPLAVIEQKQASKVSFHFVECPLLNMESIIRIMDHFAEKFEAGIKNHAYKWKFSLPMLQLLEDTSGLPRALERLFIVCFGIAGLDGKNFFAKLETEKIVFASIFYKVTSDLDAQYNIKAYVKKNLQAATKLLSYCVEGTQISGEEILDDKNPNTTIRSLERDKHIILSRSIYESFVIKMPFYFIYLYNEILDLVDPELTKKLFKENMYWQEWEKFVAYHEAFRTNLMMRLGKTQMKLQKLYPCASESDPYFDYTVKLKKLHVREASEQFPNKTMKLTDKFTGEQINWKSGEAVVINGKSAQSADVLLVREVDKKLKLLVMDQCKWDYGSKRIHQEEIDDEDKKNLESHHKFIKDCTYIPVTVIFTSQPYDGPPREGLVVISKENFEDHFGPVFSSRAKFAIIRETNPNFWDRNRLLNTLDGVGTATIDKALEKRPYFDDKGYLKINPNAKNKKQKLNYYPFNISKKLTIKNRDSQKVSYNS
jgi:hypothetical protein